MGFLKAIETIFDRIINAEEYKDKGSAGERHAYRELLSLFDEKQIIRNVYLKKKNGEYTEIDLIVVTKKGIIVLESKNYSGWIFGDEKDSYWMQTLQSGLKTKFFNPVIQNKIHIDSIKNYLSCFQNLICFSVVVFSNRCTLKKIVKSSDNVFIIKRDFLTSTLIKILSLQNEIFNDVEVDTIINLLSVVSRPEKAIKRQHQDELRKKREQRHQAILSGNICPKCCSGIIKEKTNRKTGERFYGCENFPKCKYTSNTPLS